MFGSPTNDLMSRLQAGLESITSPKPSVMGAVGVEDEEVDWSDGIGELEIGDGVARVVKFEARSEFGNRSGIGGREPEVGVIWIGAASAVCGRRIGTSGKFCTRACLEGMSSCAEVKSHSKAKPMGVRDGCWYVADESGDKESYAAYASPSLSAATIPSQSHSLIHAGRRPMTRWVLLFGSLSDAEGFAQVEELITEVDRKVSFKASPEKRTVETAFDEDIPLEEVSDTVDPWLPTAQATPKKMRLEADSYAAKFQSMSDEEKLHEVMSQWVKIKSSVMAVRTVLPGMAGKLSDAQRKINLAHAEIGERPADFTSVTVWGALSNQGNPVAPSVPPADLTKLLARLAKAEKNSEDALNQLKAQGLELQQAKSEAAIVSNFLSVDLPASIRAQLAGSRSDFGAPADTTMSEVYKERLDALETAATNQGNKLHNLASRIEGETLPAGRLKFKSLAETVAWATLQIPDGDVCFMIDCVSCLELMNLEKGTFSDNIAIATQVGKTNYANPIEAAVMESFSVTVPAVLLDTSGTKSQKDTFEGKAQKLLSSYGLWSEEDMANGVAYRIDDFISAFEERTESALMVRYNGNDSHVAYILSQWFARTTVNFLRQFVHWVNTFYVEALRVASTADAWKLTTEVIHGTCLELKKSRQVAGNLVASWQSNKQRGAGQVLWATLKAHKLMSELLSFKFSGHPRLAPYVLKHLTRVTVTRSTLSADKALIKKATDDAMAKAKAALTRADQAYAKK